MSMVNFFNCIDIVPLVSIDIATLELNKCYNIYGQSIDIVAIYPLRHCDNTIIDIVTPKP